MKNEFTYAFFNEDGSPNRMFRYNFSHYLGNLPVLIDDVRETMASPIGSRGSHVAAIWEGRLTKSEAMGPHTSPVALIYADGSVEKF